MTVATQFRRGPGKCLLETTEIVIDMPALPRPTLDEVRVEFAWTKEFARNVSTEDSVTMSLARVIDPDEADLFDIRCCEQAIPLRNHNLAGLQHKTWFLQNALSQPAVLALPEYTYIHFGGTVMRRQDEQLRVANVVKIKDHKKQDVWYTFTMHYGDYMLNRLRKNHRVLFVK